MHFCVHGGVRFSFVRVFVVLLACLFECAWCCSIGLNCTDPDTIVVEAISDEQERTGKEKERKCVCVRESGRESVFVMCVRARVYVCVRACVWQLPSKHYKQFKSFVSLNCSSYHTLTLLFFFFFLFLPEGWAIIDWESQGEASDFYGFVSSVPQGKFVVIDMSTDGSGEWQNFNNAQFFGAPFIWTTLHDFGGTVSDCVVCCCVCVRCSLYVLNVCSVCVCVCVCVGQIQFIIFHPFPGRDERQPGSHQQHSLCRCKHVRVGHRIHP